MAAPPAPPKPAIDLRCDFNTFRMKPDGNIACLGLGPVTPGELQNAPGYISGIAFQKVDTGIVKVGIREDDFTPVVWPNAPTEPPPPAGQKVQGQVLNLHDQIPLPQAPHVTQEWQEFTDSMRYIKDAMLNRMTPVKGRAPPTLLKGFQSNLWVGAEDNMRSKSSVPVMASEIEDDIRANGVNWTNNTVINTWLEAMCNGLYNPETDFKCLFEFLFPTCEVSRNNYKQILRIAPSETSKNGTMYDGVVSCLMYGLRDSQVDPRHRSRTRTPLEYRTLVPKRLGLWTRSRSRSPVSDDDDLDFHVEDPTDPNNQPLVDDVLDDPNQFILKHDKLHIYFETHKPDLVLVEWQRPNPQIPAGIACAKIIFAISSYEKIRARLEHHVRQNVEQCVQSCLAAFGSDQTRMYGLVLVVDGFKLIKVEKGQNGGVWQYQVSQTDLIMWDNANALHSLFFMISQEL